MAESSALSPSSRQSGRVWEFSGRVLLMALKSASLRITRLAFCGALAAGSGILAIAQARQLTLDDFVKAVGVSDPQISPDGKQIVCVAAHVNMEQDRTERELLLVDIDSDARRSITFERRGLASPRWSPSGDRLAFLAFAGKEKEERLQVFVMPMNGGDAFRITDAPNNVEQFAWHSRTKICWFGSGLLR